MWNNIAFGTNEHLLIFTNLKISGDKTNFSALYDLWTSKMKLVLADILSSNFFVIQIRVKSQHHFDP